MQQQESLFPAHFIPVWVRDCSGASADPSQAAHLPLIPVSLQQLRQQEASGIDIEEKEEADNVEGEPWGLALC